MKRKTHVRRNRGLKDECRGQQTRDIDPRQQQHILRMLYLVKAARLLFITLCCGSVEDNCRSRCWGVPEHPRPHGTGTDCLGEVGPHDNPPALPGGRGCSPLQPGDVNSLLPSRSRAASGGGQAGQERGRVSSGTGREAEPGRSWAAAEHAVIETVLPSPNIWCERSPKIEHFLLPPQRKQRCKETQTQQGWCKERSHSLAASHWELLTHSGV